MLSLPIRSFTRIRSFFFVTCGPCIWSNAWPIEKAHEFERCQSSTTISCTFGWKIFFGRYTKEESTWKNKIEFRVSFSKRISSLFSGSFVYEKQLGEKNSFPADFGIYDSPLSFLHVVGWFLIRTSKKFRHKELLTNSSNIVR